MYWRKIKRRMYHSFTNMLFRHQLRERLCRQEFFYNAFHALAFNGIDGDYVEFGSDGCSTFSLAFHESRKNGIQPKLWAFDSFQGLPDHGSEKDRHPKWNCGTMATPLDQFHHLCKLEDIPQNQYAVVPGYYSDTLKGFAKNDEPTNICMAYIDCDLHSSTEEVLSFLSPRLKHGMILAFDDYYCWSKEGPSGEKLAFEEFGLKHKEWNFPVYMQYGWHGLSFVVENTLNQKRQ